MSEKEAKYETVNYHIDLLAVNVNEHTEKKANLTYLSWAWAWAEVIKRDVGANYKFLPAQMFGATMMVFCDVTIFGKTITAYLPVMDHRNKAIENPDAFAVNKAMMRCLAKGIALHGLGLYIYAGEDLPESDDADRSSTQDKATETPSLTAQQARDQQGWIAAGIAEITAGRNPAEWWKEFGEKVKADCTVDGAKEVYNKVVKK
ncbi:MAG: DUF1071 domain-containing protein [Desulfobacterales bacterium]|nr:DUF1071 domain-containing protein [Desulfobacterales bacterium]